MKNDKPSEDQIAQAASLGDGELDQIVAEELNPGASRAYWNLYRTQALRDVTFLLLDQDPTLGWDFKLYPNTGPRISFEGWHEDRIVIALNLLVVLTAQNRLAGLTDLVAKAAQAIRDGSDPKHVVNAIEWGGLLV